MRLIPLLALGATTAIAASVPQQAILDDQQQVGVEQFLVELSPGETRWITEGDKWALRRVI